MRSANFNQSAQPYCVRRWAVKRIVVILLMVSGLGFWSFSRAYAQITSATILGNVTDPSGAAIPGASVTVTNEATGATYRTTSGTDGSYIVPLLPVTGTYTVRIVAKGFQAYVHKGIILQINQNVRVDAKLQLGSTAQSVQVTAQPPQVETASSSLGEVVTHREITELPLNGRNPIQLVTLTAGVTATSIPAVIGERAGSYWSSNGSRMDENQTLLDGATYEGAYFNDALNLPSPDALQEFKLITNTYSAEYGRNAGSVLNAVVKSGTNGFHGDAWEFLRNTALNSRNFFLNGPGAKVAKLDQNQFGFTAGGPAIRNKLFWFTSYQGLRIRQQAISTIFVPTADNRNGLFTMPAGRVLINPQTDNPFPQNTQGQFVIPISQFNPIATNLINTYLPLPNGPGGALTQLGTAATSVNQELIKGDYDVTQKNALNFMWMRDRTNQVSPFGLSNVLNYNPESPFTHINLYILNDTWTLRPNAVNQLRASYVRLLNFLGCGPQKSANEYGINYIPDGAPEDPDFQVSGAFSLSSSGICSLSEGTPTREVSDTLTWIKGDHDFKMGGDWFYNTNVLFADYLEEGRFQFSGAFTGNPIADFMLGDVFQYQRQTEVDTGLASTEWAGFFQDDWKLNRKLTLNLGMRYFVQVPWVFNSGGIAFSAHDNAATWAPSFRTQRFATIPPGTIWPGDEGPSGIVPRGLYRTPMHNFEPRIGFAWDPWGNGRTALRASYGIFHDLVIPDAIAQAASVQPYVYREIFNAPPGGLTNPYLGQPNPWPYRAYLQSNPQFFPPAFASALDLNTRNAVIQSWTLDVQHQLTNNFMVDLAYAGKVTDGLIMITDANPANYIPGTNAQGQPLSTLANVNSRRTYAPTWASVRLVGSYGRASYHSLQFSTQYRLRHGLSFQTAYTYSHSIDMNSNYNVAASWQEQSAFCLDCEKGDSDFDLPNVFVASAVYNLPSPFSNIQGFGGAAARTVLGNWELSGIARLTSGSPFTCLVGTGNSLNGLGNDRCDTIGNWKLSGQSTNAEVQKDFNTAAFVANPIGTLGTSQRNFLRGPAKHDVDLALMKNFPIKNERYGMFQFRAEFFNAFNWVNFNNPVNVLSSPAFGRITSAGDPRLIQFGLKYMW